MHRQVNFLDRDLEVLHTDGQVARAGRHAAAEAWDAKYKGGSRFVMILKNKNITNNTRILVRVFYCSSRVLYSRTPLYLTS